MHFRSHLISFGKFILSLVFLLSFGAATAQSQDGSYRNKEEFKNFRRTRKDRSDEQINLLKEQGALVVVLHQNLRKIDALTKIGNTEAARQAASEQLRHNKIIQQAFHKKFNFCRPKFGEIPADL